MALFVNSSPLSCREVAPDRCFDPGEREVNAFMQGTILHELSHLISYYQRTVRRQPPKTQESWLEEADASAHGQAIASSRFPAISPIFHPFLQRWLGGQYRCPLSNEGLAASESGCGDSYYGSGLAFALFLAQHYGSGVFRQLDESPFVGMNALQQAVVAVGGDFKDAFRRWGGFLALSAAGAVPAGYGYPGGMIGAYRMAAIDGAALGALRRLPDTLPATIEAYSHLPLVDFDQSGQYRRDIEVPPGVILSVYIQRRR